jgi:hypothetical protein
VDRTPEASAMGRDFPYRLQSQKRPPANGTAFAEPEFSPRSICGNRLLPSLGQVLPPGYRAAKNFRMRSRPRSNSAFEVA